MNVNGLLEVLTELSESFGESEVRLMTQEGWPFENDIHGIAVSGDILTEGDEDDVPTSDDPEVVYIVEGNQIKYGNKNAWNVARRF